MSSLATENHSSNDPRQRRPGAAEVAAELQRILDSRCFEQAGRSKEFLRFVVEQTLADRGDRLKGYTIALEVFGRPEDFDAQSDPLVRVEAGRLRRRLSEYYVAEGYTNPLRIALPRGRYEPEFSYAATDTHEVATPRSARARGSGFRLRRQYLIALAILAVALLSVVAVESDREPATEPKSDTVGAPRLSTPPRVVVEPFGNLTNDRSLDYFAAGITEEIMLQLNGFNVAVIAGRTGPKAAAATKAEDASTATYVLTGNVRNAADRIRIAARLVERDSGAQLWTAAYDESLTVPALLNIEEKIATEVTDTIAIPYGPIFRQELARSAHKPPAQLETYDCVLRYYAYRQTADPALHRDALNCFQGAVKREPKFADAWAGLALMYLDEYGFGYDPQAGPIGPLDRAQEAARTALDIDGEGLLGNLALARVRFFRGDLDGFARSAQRISTLGSTDPEALGVTGMLWTLAGFPERGAPFLKRAAALGPFLRWLSIASFATDLRAGRADEALDAALQLDMPDWYMAPVLVAAAAGLAGRQDVAQRAVARLRGLNPTFPEHARAEFGKWQVDKQLLDAVLRGLRDAGLDVD
jgi:TolB-like protein